MNTATALRKLTSISLFIIVATLLTFWTTFEGTSILRWRRALMESSQNKATLVNGTRFSVAASVTPTFENQDGVNRFLVFISSDTCPACRSQVQRWTEAIAELPFASDDMIIVFSIAGNDIPSTLKTSAEHSGVKYKSFSVSNIDEFQQTTGVSWTPQIIAMDGALRIRRLAPSMDGQGYKELYDWFAESADHSTKGADDEEYRRDADGSIENIAGSAGPIDRIVRHALH